MWIFLKSPLWPGVHIVQVNFSTSLVFILTKIVIQMFQSLSQWPSSVWIITNTKAWWQVNRKCPRIYCHANALTIDVFIWGYKNKATRYILPSYDTFIYTCGKIPWSLFIVSFCAIIWFQKKTSLIIFLFFNPLSQHFPNLFHDYSCSSTAEMLQSNEFRALLSSFTRCSNERPVCLM